MKVQQEDDIKFVNSNKILFEKAKRLLYKYGDQTPFTEEEMTKVLKILEIIGKEDLVIERLEIVRKDDDDDDA